MAQDPINNYLSKHGFGRFRPKAVLFDMDGVLYDSMPNHAKAWQQAMAQYGIVMTPDDAYATEGARGIDTIRMMVRQQQGREISLDEAQAMYDTKTRLFHEMPEARVFYGVRPLMQKIVNAGMKVGVVTGSGQRPLINRLLRDFGNVLDERHIVTAYDVDRGKPNPDPYLMGMHKMGDIKPWQTIVVENAPLGIRAAVAAQCFTIAINSGPLADECLLSEGADILLPHINLLCRSWEKLIINGMMGHKSQDTQWEEICERIITFLRNRHRRPSKYKDDELELVNWMKYNKKVLASGNMAEERKQRFVYLLTLCKRYQRVNQHQYAGKTAKQSAPSEEVLTEQPAQPKEAPLEQPARPVQTLLDFDFDDEAK